jgi:hypothetical protein
MKNKFQSVFFFSVEEIGFFFFFEVVHQMVLGSPGWKPLGGQ